MVVKMVALGIFGRRCYLGDTWNRLDFFIVMAGWGPPATFIWYLLHVGGYAWLSHLCLPDGSISGIHVIFPFTRPYYIVQSTMCSTVLVLLLVSLSFEHDVVLAGVMLYQQGKLCFLFGLFTVVTSKCLYQSVTRSTVTFIVHVIQTRLLEQECFVFANIYRWFIPHGDRHPE